MKFILSIPVIFLFAAHVFPVGTHSKEIVPLHDSIYYVKISTPQGSCIIRLYNQTPVHRDNFLHYVKSGYFNHTFFHRVIKNFVIQGGDPDSFYVAPQKGYYEFGAKRIAPEFNDSLFHKKGVLAMGRDDNPEQSSFYTQLYLVQGRKYTDAELDQVEIKYRNGKKIPAWQREIYKTIGGLPRLDQHYTVIGELVSGEQMIDSIAALPTGREDNPLKEVPIRISIYHLP